jgi:hypothetical protein
MSGGEAMKSVQSSGGGPVEDGEQPASGEAYRRRWLRRELIVRGGSAAVVISLPGSRRTSWQFPGSWSAPAAGLLEDIPHDRSMQGFDSSPQCACDGVLVLHERGEEEGVLLTFEEQFRWLPDAGVGTKEDCCDATPSRAQIRQIPLNRAAGRGRTIPTGARFR